MPDSIPLPPRVRELLEQLIRERERVNLLIETVVTTAKAALDVPEPYIVRSLDVGFEPPEAPPQG